MASSGITSHKLHMDQNGKLAMYCLAEVSAYDGYSRKTVAFTTMLVKNNVLIYEHNYRYQSVILLTMLRTVSAVVIINIT